MGLLGFQPSFSMGQRLCLRGPSLLCFRLGAVTVRVYRRDASFTEFLPSFLSPNLRIEAGGTSFFPFLVVFFLIFVGFHGNGMQLTEFSFWIIYFHLIE